MRIKTLNRIYVFCRVAAFLCLAAAIATAFVGARIAGSLLLMAFGLFGVGALMNVWLGLTAHRVYLGTREVAKQSQPALFRLWLFLNAFLALSIGVAALFVGIVRYS